MTGVAGQEDLGVEADLVGEQVVVDDSDGEDRPP